MKRFPIILCVLILAGVAAAFVQQLRRDARTENCRNNLRLVGLLVRQYASEHGKLPHATTYDVNGTALQSWRLSAVETREYFDFSQYMDASKPWTTPTNREFFKTFDDSIFACPSASSIDGITQYVAIVGDGTAWDKNTDVDDIRDETLLIIEWPNSDIYWAEPRDIRLDELASMLTVDQFRTEHSDSLRYIDWSATVHEIPLDGSTFDTVRKLARVPAASNATQTPAK